MSAGGGSNFNHGPSRQSSGWRVPNNEQKTPRNWRNEGARSHQDAIDVNNDRNRGNNRVSNGRTASGTHFDHLSTHDTQGSAAASPALSRQIRALLNQEPSQPSQPRNSQHGSGPTGGHGHSNHRGIGASAGIPYHEHRPLPGRMTEVMETTVLHDYGRNQEEMRRRRNHQRRSTPAAERRRQQRRGKQQEYAMSQKDQHDCNHCERKKETIETLREQNKNIFAGMTLAKYKKDKILLQEKQQRAQLEQLFHKMECFNKELMHLKQQIQYNPIH